MKKLTFLCVVICLFLSLNIVAQYSRDFSAAYNVLENRVEVFFSFSLDAEMMKPDVIEEISKIISIDKIEGTKVWAYANRAELDRFSELNIEIELLQPPSTLINPLMLDTQEALLREEWDYYPTYMAYVNLMNQFASEHPDLCEVVSIKTLASTREIILIHINDSLGVEQAEPQFLYTSSIHGDETTGYILMLHLVDYLLENYGQDDQVTNLVNNIDIWINPLANPDGTYAGGNNNIYGATRFNANGVDMNRNYADPEDGLHPDGNEYQPETQAFMDFADNHHFVASANFHGGAEVCNYPWDTWSPLAADDDWWVYVCRQWVDTVHEYSVPGYMTDLDNGITNGYAWYSISGGRQDYMNYFHNCREFTAEISSTKLLPESQLEDFWEYNYRSLLNYMEQVLFGIRGVVTSAATGQPVPAKIFIDGHDLDKSEVYASMPLGNYHRLVKAGTYDLVFSCFGYKSKVINDVVVTDQNILLLNVELEPLLSLTADFSADQTWVPVNQSINFTDKSLGENIVSWSWNFDGAEPSTSNEKNPQNIYYSSTGTYNVSLTVTNGNGESDTVLKENYIKVADVYNMENDTVYTCSALFFDSGGATEPYSDNEIITMTFVSELESGYLKVIFDPFNIESSDNCQDDYLEIYDGKNTNSPLIGTYCGSTVPESFVTNNIDGAVTFYFKSNESITKPGWKALITCDTNVGVQTKEALDLTIYPNPAENSVILSSPLVIQRIQLYDLNGKQILFIEPFNEKAEIEITNQKPGMYILEVTSGNQTAYRKLMVK